MPPSPALSSYFLTQRSPWNRLDISLVAAACTILIIFSFYHIFKFRHASSRDRNLRELLESHPDNSSSKFQKHGLHFANLQALPAIEFRKTDGEVADPNDNDCAVCLGQFEEGDWVRLLPGCAHVFHISCIDTWFQCHSTCPLCRLHVMDVFESSQGYPISADTSLETLSREDPHSHRMDDSQVLELLPTAV